MRECKAVGMGTSSPRGSPIARARHRDNGREATPGSLAAEDAGAHQFERRVEAWRVVLDTFQVAGAAYDEVADGTTDQAAAETARRISHVFYAALMPGIDRLVMGRNC